MGAIIAEAQGARARLVWRGGDGRRMKDVKKKE